MSDPQQEPAGGDQPLDDVERAARRADQHRDEEQDDALESAFEDQRNPDGDDAIDDGDNDKSAAQRLGGSDLA
jgi:hypothetical protein